MFGSLESQGGSFMNIDKVVHKKTYVWKKEKGCAITITEQGKKNILNPDYTLIWEEIDDIKKIGDIAEIFSQKKNITFQDAVEKVTYMIQKLEKADLVSLENYLWLEDFDD